MASPNIWCVIPAAGAGRRMGTDIPKQYLQLCGRKVIEHTLARMGCHPRISGVRVAVAEGDPWWPEVGIDAAQGLKTCPGGAERGDSVLSGLRALVRDGADANDWVMVHDAVRPCVRREDIDRLIDEGGAHAVGGVLGIAVRDTMKRVGTGDDVIETVNRERLWHAFTPQMFRLGALTRAIERARNAGMNVTDEAQAMERAGQYPRMVAGHADNVKITVSDDLLLAEQFLNAQTVDP